METLAYTHVAVHYEELNSSSELRAFRNIKLKALKAVKSIAIAVGCITGGVVLGTVAQAETVHTTFSYGDRGSGIATLQSKLGGIAVDGIFGSQTLNKLKSYQTAHGLPVNGIATPDTLTSLGLHNLTHAPIQYGKLKLINDKPYATIIFLSRPGEKSSRYAYLPGCTERTIESYYSNLSQVSLDLQRKVSIGNFKKGFFVVKASSLINDKNGSLCLGHANEIGSTASENKTQFTGLNKPTYLEVNSQQVLALTTSANKLDELIKFTDELIEVVNSNGWNPVKNLEKNAKKFRKLIAESIENIPIFIKPPDVLTDATNPIAPWGIQLDKEATNITSSALKTFLQTNGQSDNFGKLEPTITTLVDHLSRKAEIGDTNDIRKWIEKECGYTKGLDEMMDLILKAIKLKKLAHSLIQLENNGNSNSQVAYTTAANAFNEDLSRLLCTNYEQQMKKAAPL